MVMEGARGAMRLTSDGQTQCVHSTAQHSTAQHSTAFYIPVKRLRHEHTTCARIALEQVVLPEALHRVVAAAAVRAEWAPSHQLDVLLVLGACFVSLLRVFRC